MIAYHQTDEDGVFAGHKMKDDLDWNRHLILDPKAVNTGYKHGNTNYTDFRLANSSVLIPNVKPVETDIK